MERSEIPRYVPDASVAVKWFVEERDSRRARRLKELFQDGAVDLDAPSLLRYEVASALKFHPTVRFTPVQLQTVMKSLDDLQLIREPRDREWATAFGLSFENSISVYDAVYLAFAVCGQSKMVTADGKMKMQLKSSRTAQKAIMLTDLAL